MLLALDTATQVMSIALHSGDTLLAEQTWQSDHHHTTLLAPTVHQLLAHCEVKMDALTALAVAIGPGSFTGVRIGVALAKGLASARKLPLVGVNTLDILAAGQPQFSGALVAIIQAGRGRILVGRYRWTKGRWVNRGEVQLMQWDKLFASIDGQAFITGEVDAEGRRALEQASAKGVPVTLVPAAHRLRRAGFLAEVAWERLKAGQPDDFLAAKLVPLYAAT